MLQGESRHCKLDSPCRAYGMTNHRLLRADRDFICIITKKPLDCSCLCKVIVESRSAMSIDVADFFLLYARVSQS